MASLEKEYDFKEEHFDFIQQHIRKFCLSCKRPPTTFRIGKKWKTLVFRWCSAGVHKRERKSKLRRPIQIPSAQSLRFPFYTSGIGCRKRFYFYVRVLSVLRNICWSIANSFSPAGWDNEKKISILYENLSSMQPEDDYSDHIRKPVLRRVKKR